MGQVYGTETESHGGNLDLNAMDPSIAAAKFLKSYQEWRHGDGSVKKVLKDLRGFLNEGHEIESLICKEIELNAKKAFPGAVYNEVSMNIH